MKLKVITKKTVAIMHPENIVYVNKDKHGVLFEISCRNSDVYRFFYNGTSTEEADKFINMCEAAIDTFANDTGNIHVCQFKEFEHIKFEKSSFSSHID